MQAGELSAPGTCARLASRTRERRTSQTDSCSAAHGTEEGRIDGTEFGTVRVGFVGLDWVACDGDDGASMD